MAPIDVKYHIRELLYKIFLEYFIIDWTMSHSPIYYNSADHFYILIQLTI